MKKWIKLSVIISLALLVAACGDKEENTTKEINQHIEATVQIEAEFEENQEKIAELEDEDEKYYEDIIQLGSDDYDEIVELADKAIDLLEERLDLVEEEKESIQSAQEEFVKIENLIGDLSDEDLKKITQEMYDSMMERYDSYDDVYKQYVTSVELTEELYILLKEEEFNEDDVYDVIADVNESYDKVAKAFEIFNNATTKFNEEKQSYYEYITK